ncbi:MAG: hypothetical protein K5745_09205 [Saccharofermentans sp.]|nr:hypothetical protein [Saccharofermentans sp.]
MKKAIAAAIMAAVIAVGAGCSSKDAIKSSDISEASESTLEDTGARISKGIEGTWYCDEYASDEETYTGFYVIYIEEDGYFSIYDQEGGNPGISGYMTEDTGSSVVCEFEGDEFDPPYCWELDSSEDTLEYTFDGSVLKIGHNGVWLTFSA